MLAADIPRTAAAAGLAGHNQIEARYKRNELSAGAGFLARVGRDTRAAASALGPMAGRQLPAVGEDLRIKFPAHLGSRHAVRWSGSLVHKPFWNDLPVFPPPAAQHAEGNSSKVAGWHTNPMRGVPANFVTAIIVLK